MHATNKREMSLFFTLYCNLFESNDIMVCVNSINTIQVAL